ncbi:hypothetical protein HanXRQr2_Chr01g0037191 [Helianthus annuus]|uniref:Uncharacterized protein n=1 Tax=Helianthus annuus TaxID=4232 RepID=A0A251VSE6_HELAN|nr:hypothetical protein HanXRQr2_Chr01g0037191 [Helianthus annuus]
MGCFKKTYFGSGKMGLTKWLKGRSWLEFQPMYPNKGRKRRETKHLFKIKQN